MSKFSWERFQAAPIVGIIRNVPQEPIQRIAELYAAGGLTTLEITLNTPGAADIIYQLKNSLGNDLNIGAGTVCSIDELDLALNAGASFIVTPIINEEVIIKCVNNGIPIFPGAFTPSEIYKAWSLGAQVIKIFPATKLGVDYIREVLGPLNQMKLMPTGGVSFENCESFFKAGAAAVGMGSNLFPKDLIAAKDWSGLEAIYKRYAGMIRSIRPVAR